MIRNTNMNNNNINNKLEYKIDGKDSGSAFGNPKFLFSVREKNNIQWDIEWKVGHPQGMKFSRNQMARLS